MVETDEYHFGVAGKTMKAMTNSDIVFSGEVEFSTDYWTTIKFSKSFEYHGKNILVCINDATGTYISDYSGAGSSYFSTFLCSYDYSGIAYRTLFKNSSSNKFDATSPNNNKCAGSENTSFIQFTFSSIGTAYPDEPVLNTPINNATNQFFPELNFTLGKNTTDYKIYYKNSNTNDFISVSGNSWIEKENDYAVSYILTDLVYNNSANISYDWQIVARNANDPSDAIKESDIYKFTTARVAKPYDVSSSYNEETKKTTISWTHNTINNGSNNEDNTITYNIYINGIKIDNTSYKFYEIDHSSLNYGNNEILVSVVKGDNESAKSDPITIEVIKYGNIEVSIKDNETNAIEGVSATFTNAYIDEPYVFITDENGSFSSDEILLGNYTVTFSKYGYETVVKEIEITDNPQSTTIEVTMNSAIAIYDNSGWNIEPANNDVIIKADATITSVLTVKSIIIEENASLTLSENAILTVTGKFTNTIAENLIINDGAQIFQNNEDVQATFNMNIINPQDNVWSTEQKDGWQFISSPFTNASISNFTNNIEGNYDLYKYDGTKESAEWVNQKYNDNFFETEFVLGRAYLASYETETTARLSGTLNNETILNLENIYYSPWDETPYENYHLIGNPFPFNMNLTESFWNNKTNKIVKGYATINGEGSYEYHYGNSTIPVGDGFFIKTNGANASLYYEHIIPSKSRSQQTSSINVIATSKAGNDNVVICFSGEKDGFDKLQNFNREIANIYVENNGSRYGIYNCDENTTEVELSFVASQMGTYSISLDINGDFENVVLVDRLTGIETNMLIEDEYKFVATSNDNAKRFFIRLDNGQQSTDNDSMFVYQSGEELIVNAEGTIQIIDMMGRVVYSSEIINNRINVSGLNKSAYIVRNINENTVRTQKIVIL